MIIYISCAVCLRNKHNKYPSISHVCIGSKYIKFYGILNKESLVINVLLKETAIYLFI